MPTRTFIITADVKRGGSGMPRRFLVTGGAGYVGSHVVAALVDRGDDVVVIDNLRTGHRAAVLPPARLVQADLADAAALEAVVHQLQLRQRCRLGVQGHACRVPNDRGLTA